MNKPVLVIMAAGMGSRYGGLKQIDPIDEDGHIIIDFSIYDARRAGFETVIFIIKKENEEEFKEVIGDRMEQIMNVKYVYQDLANIPAEFSLPAGRVKPWGTAHAIWSCKDLIDGPFAVINADDYYGVTAYKQIYDFLLNHPDGVKYNYAMVGYYIENTLTENGHVARGVCQVNDKQLLVDIHERTQIVRNGAGAKYTEDDGQSWVILPKGTIVSMNLWGYNKSILLEIEKGINSFFEIGLKENPLKCEYFIPAVVSKLLDQNKVEVTVLESQERWYGVTYREDKPIIQMAIKELKDAGVYPKHLWKE